MALFKTCPHCGANLDPGEVCDCLREEQLSFLPTLPPPVMPHRAACLCAACTQKRLERATAHA